MKPLGLQLLGVTVLLAACGPPAGDSLSGGGAMSSNLATHPTEARAADGSYISWREHLIDDEAISGVAIRGSDGLVMADLDGDGHLDIVSVHESDTEYDGVSDGHVRIAFGGERFDPWKLVTLAEGAEAGAAEDVAVGDVNGDGYPDVVAACELAHLIYFQNPGASSRSARWERVIPPVTTGRGSFIRVFLGDLDRDGDLEVVATNKGSQSPDADVIDPTAISWFEIDGPPLDGASWVEHELTRIRWPINSQTVDLDGDGDLDVVGGSVAERRILWFENVVEEAFGDFVEHPIAITGTSLVGDARPETERGHQRALVNGFNLDFVDLSGDGRLDIVTFEGPEVLGHTLVWLEQPAERDGGWQLHRVGSYAPDSLVGLAVADITGDGHPDVMTGGYSRGPRDVDGDVTPNDPLGRLAWFENPGDASAEWTRHDISRRKRGMFDKFIPHDMDGDGDVDFVSTRGNSVPYDGVFWLEQVRSAEPVASFEPARERDSEEMPLPPGS